MQTNNVARPKIFLLRRQAPVILTLNYQKKCKTRVKPVACKFSKAADALDYNVDCDDLLGDQGAK